MIGILIVSHGTLGESLIHCATHVIGRRPQHLMQLGVTSADDPDKLLPQAVHMVKQLDQGDGVLILSDICGATPCNIARRLATPGKVECVAGVNLPMLVRVLTYRDESLATLIGKALSGGQEGVIHINADRCNAATGS